MHRLLPLTLILTAAAIANVAFSQAAHAVDVVVVCPQKFRQSMQAWIDYRQSQGQSVAVVNSQSDTKTLTTGIQEASDEKTRYVVLVGDAPVIGTKADVSRQVPTHYLKTTVTAKWGSSPTMASDMPFGDFDQDKIPDAAVGRLPVQRAVELDQFIDRIIAYERSDDFGSWRGQVQLVGGIGGFGMMADAAIESVTRTVVTSVLPTETRTHVVYASPGHLFYPKGDSFTDAVVKQYANGARFWVYAGHGQVTELDRVPQTRDGIPVLDYKTLTQLDRPAKSAPIALMLACYTGAIDAARDSLGERMVLFDGGPIALFAGSRITMPYGNATAAIGLIKGVYEEKSPRLGDAWLSTLKQMHADDPQTKSTSRMMIDAVAALVSPSGTKLVDERHEHMGLYNLFGDPMLSLHPAKPAKVTVPPGFDNGEAVAVSVNSPIDGESLIQIDRPLGAITKGNPNDTTIAEMRMPVRSGQDTTSKFLLPSDVMGPLVVRVIVSGDKEWATGSAKTMIRRPADKK